MICPACRKKQTSIIKEKVEKNITVTRNRYCSCGYSFVTYETTRKLNLNRKTRPDSNWKNFRFIVYANFRLLSALKIKPKIDIDKNDGLGLFKFKGKSFWAYGIGQNMKFKDVEKKKDTIKDILKTQFYWSKRNYYFQEKSSEDMNNKDIVRKEAQQYFKSVCTYITHKQYNQSFFINNPLDKFLPKIKNREINIWEDNNIWKNVWLKIR